ncbi:FIMAH domain-containing protein [Cellulomonas endophytica]|uniref:FIMAH domain-containing protein n=1 Tax=Cellulomonas endophytica TaxID=2494735 RepID=UPI00196A46F6|nr:alpha/beta hydrolase-fold protein [Cellulomonas endophytica]
MRAAQTTGGAPADGGAVAVGQGGRRVRRLVLAAGLGLAMALTAAPGVAVADDHVDLTPGPTVVRDLGSPTGYTGHFVLHAPEASSVRFVADIMLRDWEDPTDPTVYAPSEYRPGLMRGGGAYEVEMTEVEDGYWVTDVPLAAGANQYWFYVDGDTSLWVTDPANAPVYAPDGLQGTARRAFNRVNVPYDAERQDFAPLAARQVENPRPGSPKGTWGYVPLEVGGAERTVGVYLPPGYDADRAVPYKTIYMQHGGGQDQSDWLNMGSVPVIMDNLLQDGLTEPAVVVTTATDYLGDPEEGYPALRDVVLPFVEGAYNVSTEPVDRAFAGLSRGSIVTQNIIDHDPTLFGWYGPWSGGARLDPTTPGLATPYILFGGGAWDFGLPDAEVVESYDNALVQNVVVAGAHDFNAWNQLFTIFARDYLWQPEAFVAPYLDETQDELDALQADREVAGAVSFLLEEHLSAATRLAARGRTDAAVVQLERFVERLDAPPGASSRVSDTADVELRERAETLIENLAAAS